MFKNRFSWIMILFLLVTLLIGCGSGPEKKLFGYWSSDEGTMEFFEDGTIVIDDELVGNYTILDESKLRIDGGGNSLIFTFEVSDDSLTLSDSRSTAIFTRGESFDETGDRSDDGESTSLCQGATFEATRVVLTDISEVRVPVPTPVGADNPCMIEVTRVVFVESIEDSMPDFIEQQK